MIPWGYQLGLFFSNILVATYVIVVIRFDLEHTSYNHLKLKEFCIHFCRPFCLDVNKNKKKIFVISFSANVKCTIDAPRRHTHLARVLRGRIGVLLHIFYLLSDCGISENVSILHGNT